VNFNDKLHDFFNGILPFIPGILRKPPPFNDNIEGKFGSFDDDIKLNFE